MKKYAKLLCAVLVLAILCTSLLFVSSAEDAEFAPAIELKELGLGVTPPANAMQSIVLNGAEDNLVLGISRGNNAAVAGVLPGNGAYFTSYTANYSDDEYYLIVVNQDYNPGYNANDKEKNDKDGDGKPDQDGNPYIAVDIKDTNFSIADGTEAMYVFEFDIATQSEIFDEAGFELEFRQGENGSSGFPFGKLETISAAVDPGDEWIHLVFVGDVATNEMHAFANGEYVGVIAQAYDSAQTSGAKVLCAKSARIFLSTNGTVPTVTKGQSIAFDNLSERVYPNGNESLKAALNNKDITAWSGYVPGRGEELLPALATVDGVEYRSSGKLAKALNTNDTVNVEFLAQPLVPVIICANAKINTNGMDQDKLFKLANGCEIKSINGNIVTTTAPFVSNDGEEHVSPSMAFSLLKSDRVENNLLSRFQAINFDKDNCRAMYKVFDTYTGKVSYINERVLNGDPSSANTYNEWHPTGSKIPYVTGVDQHIVVDFDVAMYSSGLEYTFKTVTRTSSGGSAWGDNDDISLKTLLADYDLGEFVHITMVLSTDTRDTTVFINGVYSYTKTGNISNNTNHYFQCLRVGGNSAASVGYANISIREFRGDELTSAVTAKDISAWSGNVYDTDYDMPVAPAKVVIDEVPYSDEAEIERALYGNRETPAVVKILHVFEETITVNCNARIYTYGQNVKFVDVKGNDLIPDANSIIRVELPYMEVGSEENVGLTGGVANSQIFDAIKGNANGNLFTSFVPSLGNWGAAGYRNAALLTNIETHDVMYRDSAVLNSDGTMNDDSAEYVDMKFKPTVIKNENNEYIVVDFDFGTDRELTDGVFVQLVPSAGASASEGGILLKDLGIFAGDMAHVTIVYDFAQDCAYAFVNSVFACVVDGITEAADGTQITVDSFRLSTGEKTSPVCLDNVAVRFFEYDSAEDELAAAVESNKLTSWSGNIYTSNYTVSKLPTLAVVTVIENGEEYVKEYGSIDSLNKFLSIDADYQKIVEMKYCPDDDVKVRTEVTVDTHGLNIALDWNTGLYEFHPGEDRYTNDGAGISAYSTSKFIYTTVGNTYTFKIINADNCWSNASVAIWANGIAKKPEVTLSDYRVVFYSYGEKMEPIMESSYVEGDKLYTDRWSEVTITAKDNFTTATVSEYPVANSTEKLKIYYSRTSSSDASNYAITDMLYASNIGTDILFTLYVKKTNSLVTDTGRVVNIDGTDYMAFDYSLAPHEIDKVITVSFEVKYMNSVYTQVKEICYVDYLRGLLETTDFNKELIVSLLDYANKSHVLFENSEMKSVTELINEYEQYLPQEEIEEKADTSELSQVIRSASMRLNSTPEFVFRVARGFNGTITFSYNSLGTPVERSFDVNALASEQVITLDGLYIYDLAEDITITVTGSNTCEGVYNLSSYAHSLENNDFAVALYNYALCALEHKAGAENLPA